MKQTNPFNINDLLQDLELPEESELTTGTLPSASEKEDIHKPIEKAQAEEWDHFNKIEQVFIKGQNIFTDQNYLQSCIQNEEYGLAMCETLKKLHQTEIPEDRTRLRALLIGQYWQVLESVAEKVGTPQLLPAKKLFLRYAVFSPGLISDEQRALLSSIPMHPHSDDQNTIFYLDEWFETIARGTVNPSLLTEINVSNRQDRRKQLQNAQYTKLQGQSDTHMIQIKGQNDRIKNILGIIQNRILTISRRDPDPQANGEMGSFNEQQRRCISEIPGLLRDISVANRTLKNNLSELYNIKKRLKAIEETEGEAQAEEKVVLLPKLARQEAITMRQMAKLCVGRSGNHFPILYKSHFQSTPEQLGTRENINNLLADLEYLDPNIFLRTFRNVTRRIVPYIILVPSYGNSGVCWESFERQNRSTSRGRVIIPMYPRNLKGALTAAMGDLRWQQAKEQASRFWMEEGLTGWYYDYYTQEKLKGDIKDHFIRDYITWITKESEGTQLLHKSVRDIFWRYIPYPQAVKDTLKNRGYVYQQLVRKDLNRDMSSMY